MTKHYQSSKLPRNYKMPLQSQNKLQHNKKPVLQNNLDSHQRNNLAKLHRNPKRLHRLQNSQDLHLQIQLPKLYQTRKKLHLTQTKANKLQQSKYLKLHQKAEKVLFRIHRKLKRLPNPRLREI
uniref:Uncharacterized protein n=1 Tax=Cacopsylla melanoneura TaxID=428564 RepID=A0A8D8XG77_9HEMI